MPVIVQKKRDIKKHLEDYLQAEIQIHILFGHRLTCRYLLRLTAVELHKAIEAERLPLYRMKRYQENRPLSPAKERMEKVNCLLLQGLQSGPGGEAWSVSCMIPMDKKTMKLKKTKSRIMVFDATWEFILQMCRENRVLSFLRS